jgi:hypothetical protein
VCVQRVSQHVRRGFRISARKGSHMSVHEGSHISVHEGSHRSVHGGSHMSVHGGSHMCATLAEHKSDILYDILVRPTANTCVISVTHNFVRLFMDTK